MRFQKFPDMSRRGHTFLNTRNNGLWKSDQSWSENSLKFIRLLRVVFSSSLKRNVTSTYLSIEAKFLISYASQLFTSQLFPHTWCSIVMSL